MKRKERTPEDRARRHVLMARLEMWGWMLFTIPYMLWLRDSVAVVGLLSVYALVITMKGVKTAAQAEVAGYANPEMPDEPADDPAEAKPAVAWALAPSLGAAAALTLTEASAKAGVDMTAATALIGQMPAIGT